jgi:uncharacterized protein YutE (UPF0331/DUF86 family)
MNLRRDTVHERLKELDRTVTELGRYVDLSASAVDRDLSLRWVIERGLIAAAALMPDVADHILVAHFGFYPSSYEDSFRLLLEEGVISAELYEEVRGLGGLRNILVHQYQNDEPELMIESHRKGLRVFPDYSRAILAWLDATEN